MEQDAKNASILQNYLIGKARTIEMARVFINIIKIHRISEMSK